MQKISWDFCCFRHIDLKEKIFDIAKLSLLWFTCLPNLHTLFLLGLCVASSPNLLHFSSPSICLLLRRAPLSAHEFLTMPHLPAPPAHLWQLLIPSRAPITCSTPRWFCQSLSGDSTDSTHTTELGEELQRQSGFSRGSFKLLVTRGADSKSERWLCLWLRALRSWAEAALSQLCTQLQEFEFLEGREGSYFCNMPWQSLLMHRARCPRRQEIYWGMVIHTESCPPCAPCDTFPGAERRGCWRAGGCRGGALPGSGRSPRAAPSPVRHREGLLQSLGGQACGRAWVPGAQIHRHRVSWVPTGTGSAIHMENSQEQSLKINWASRGDSRQCWPAACSSLTTLFYLPAHSFFHAHSFPHFHLPSFFPAGKTHSCIHFPLVPILLLLCPRLLVLIPLPRSFKLSTTHWQGYPSSVGVVRFHSHKDPLQLPVHFTVSHLAPH